MEHIIFASLIILYLVFIGWACYRAGYAAREKIFQENPVTFRSNDKDVVWVGRDTGIVKIRIFDQDKVEIIK